MDNIEDILRVAHSLFDKLMYDDSLLLFTIAESIILELRDDMYYSDNIHIYRHWLTMIQKVKKKTFSLSLS